MTAPIEDVSSLPGKKISDQAENPLGKVKEIYATDGSVEMSSGIAKKRTVFIPLARIKDEDGELRVPYSAQRIGEAPEIDDSDGISAECDRKLRDYYGIDTGDQELRRDNKSYATLVHEDGGESQRVENADEIETPDADTRTDESRERLRDPGSAEMRQVTAEDVAHNTQETDGEDENREAGDRADGEAGDRTDREAGDRTDREAGDRTDREVGDRTDREAADRRDHEAGDSES